MPTAARQLVNLTFFMRSFDVCSPLGFSKAGVLHFGLGRKYYISLLVTISLKKALFCPTSLERAEQMSSLCCFSSLLRMKGPILAGSSYLCKFSLRMIHKIIAVRAGQETFSTSIPTCIIYGGKLRLTEGTKTLLSVITSLNKPNL